MRKRDEPAFPTRDGTPMAYDNDGSVTARRMDGTHGGLTKLEYTAIQALQGLLANKADGPIIKQAMSFAIVLWDELEKEK